MNNFYGMGGQPVGETMGMQFIARIGAGANPEQMHAERVNGYDPLPVIDAFRRKKKILEEGQRAGTAGYGDLPISGHSPSDASSYRSKEELEGGRRPIRFPRSGEMVEPRGGHRRQLEARKQEIERAVFETFELLAISRRVRGCRWTRR